MVQGYQKYQRKEQLVNLWKYSEPAVPEFLLLFFMGFCVFLKCFQEKIFCVSSSKILSSDIFVPARVKITVPVSTDLEDDVIFYIKDFENSSSDRAVLAASSIASRRNCFSVW